MKLQDKVAIITGGAMGNGLGAVKTFLKYKAKVCIFDYSDEVFKTKEQLKDDGYDVDVFKLDIRDKESINLAVLDIINKYNKIDILVNNAGVAKFNSFVDISDSERDYQFDINIKGPWNVTMAVIPYMLKANYGKIVNVSSVTGYMVADPSEVAYATTKAALIGFTKSLAAEYVRNNITVNAICPGYIMTPLVEKVAVLSNPQNPNEVVEGIRKSMPTGRMGTIEEFGELAAFLASDESSYITGTQVVIDGASTLPETGYVGN
ncbi:MAG: SDR family oxidoreductase UcpA [Bacilli bacterium]